MIVVTGTKRSGTSLWMQILAAAGLPWIGERFPEGWDDAMRDANPEGFYESELTAGVYYRTNPHPETGAYLAPQATRQHAVKIFVPGLVRTDVAFLDRVIATLRSWRAHVVSSRRVDALAPGDAVPGAMPPALDWWCQCHALVRDLAIRGYPVHVVSYEALLRQPERIVAEVVGWIGRGDAVRAATVVRRDLDRARPAVHGDDQALAEGIAARHLEVFDALHAAIDEERPLTADLIDALNRTDAELRPIVLQHRAAQDAEAIAGVLGRR